MQIPLVRNDSQHHAAYDNVKWYFKIFVVVDLFVLGTFAQKDMSPEPLSTQLHNARVCVTVLFSVDVILAMAVMRAMHGSRSQVTAAWWADLYNWILANLVMNGFSTLALSVYQLAQARGNTIQLLTTLFFIGSRAAKLRPLIKLHQQLVFILDHPDDPHRCDDLLSTWAPNPGEKKQKLLTRVTLVCLAVAVIIVGLAACLDASHVNHLPMSVSDPVNITDVQPISLFAKPMQLPKAERTLVAGGRPRGLVVPLSLQACSCDSALDDTLKGGSAGGIAGLGWCVEGGPAAAAACSATAGMYGLGAGLLCYAGTCR